MNLQLVFPTYIRNYLYYSLRDSKHKDNQNLQLLDHGMSDTEYTGETVITLDLYQCKLIINHTVLVSLNKTDIPRL